MPLGADNQRERDGFTCSVVNDLVIANRILAHENVLDAYVMSACVIRQSDQIPVVARAQPELVEHDDILEHTLDGKSRWSSEAYVERFIHGAIYEINPEFTPVVHSHALEVLPFSISSAAATCRPHGERSGHHIPVWDIPTNSGDTTLLVVNQEQAGTSRMCSPEPRGPDARPRFCTAGRSLGEVMKHQSICPRMPRVDRGAPARRRGKILRSEIAARDTFGPGGTDFARAWEYWAVRAGCGGLPIREVMDEKRLRSAGDLAQGSSSSAQRSDYNGAIAGLSRKRSLRCWPSPAGPDASTPGRIRICYQRLVAGFQRANRAVA